MTYLKNLLKNIIHLSKSKALQEIDLLMSQSSVCIHNQEIIENDSIKIVRNIFEGEKSCRENKYNWK